MITKCLQCSEKRITLQNPDRSKPPGLPGLQTPRKIIPAAERDIFTLSHGLYPNQLRERKGKDDGKKCEIKNRKNRGISCHKFAKAVMTPISESPNFSSIFMGSLLCDSIWPPMEKKIQQRPTSLCFKAGFPLLMH